jgi:AcrR family transcriptional regulator
MKTRDRILVASLELFNAEGEANTTTIDIANELDISPGNLYYHFKGKDEIIRELFQQYDQALSDTLTAPIEQGLGADRSDVEYNWYYLYVVMEEMYDYRFFYLNLDDIRQRYSDIHKGFRRLIQLKRAALYAVCQSLLQEAVIEAGEQQMVGLVDNLTLALTFWFNYEQLIEQGRPPQVTIHQGVLQLMTMVAPYLGDEQMSFYRDCESIYTNMLEQSN